VFSPHWDLARKAVNIFQRECLYIAQGKRAATEKADRLIIFDQPVCSS
jgi:hypothetical protein